MKISQPIPNIPIGKLYMGVPKKMNKAIKALALMLLLVVSMVSLTGLTVADETVYGDASDVVIEYIEIDNVAIEGTSFGAEVGDTIDIELWVQISTDAEDDGITTVEDLKIEAWVGGYEYDNIEVSTSEFNMDAGVLYKKTLSLELPSDMDVEDDHEYTLNIDLFDGREEVSEELTLYIERDTHSLNIIDVEFDSNVDAGDEMDVNVRVENFGENKEEDIRVEAELVGVDSDRVYIDELAAFEIDNEDEETSESASLTLNVDDDVVSGEYELLVTVTYNRGHDAITESYTVNVNGAEAVVAEEAEESNEATEGTIIAVDSTSLSLSVGEENSVKVLIANVGSEDAMYTVAVSGTELWADSTVSSSFVSVPAGQVGETYVYLTAKDGAETGDHVFTLQISEDGNLVGEASLTATVEESTSLNLFNDVSSAWKLAFVGLIVLIIVIGLFLAFRKMNNDDDDYPLEPKDGQTYY